MTISTQQSQLNTKRGKNYKPYLELFKTISNIYLRQLLN